MNLLGVSRVTGHEIYLGLPLMFGRAIKEEFSSIKKRIESRLQGWNGKLLSQSGKGVLIRSVLQSISAYTMGCYKLPISLLREINSMIASFWWGGKQGKKKIHWFSWDKLCCSKMEGGQGFKELDLFNQAMLAKTLWRLLQDDQLLVHQVLRAKYCGSLLLRDAMLSNKSSLLWKSLMFGRELVDLGSCWRVGNGENIDVWSDRWLRDAPFFRPAWTGRDTPRPLKVSSLIDSHVRKWDGDLLARLFAPDDVDRILATPLGGHGGSDKLIWKHTPSGEFTVKSAYVVAKGNAGKVVMRREDRHPAWRLTWTAKVAPKGQHHMWRLLHDICPTTSALSRRGLVDIVGCPVCGSPVENPFHVYFSCPLGVAVWRALCPQALTKATDIGALDDLWLKWLQAMAGGDVLEIAMVACWHIWKNRNECLHQHTCSTALSLVHKIQQYWHDYLTANLFGTVSNRRRRDEVAWQAPPAEWVKVNVDATFDKDTGLAKLGAVAKDHVAVVLFSKASSRSQVQSVLEAELWAILHGVKLARQNNLLQILIESDSLVAIREIRKGEASFSSWGAVIQDIIGEASSMTCRFGFVHREANEAAHNVAHSYLALSRPTTLNSSSNL